MRKNTNLEILSFAGQFIAVITKAHGQYLPQNLPSSVFAVKYRKATISIVWRQRLFGVINNLINESNAKTIIVNGTDNHVHCFFDLKPVMSAAELMKVVKAKSSKYINENNLTAQRFEWQEGYGVFSYGPRDVDNVYNYIRNQEEHHKIKSFMEEYLQILEDFDIQFDGHYLFEDPI